MGDILKAIYDDYQDYRALCEKMGESPVSDRGSVSFYKEWDRLKKKQEKAQLRS